MDNILIITRNFPPLVGGMERLIDHATRELRKKYSCTIIGPAGCENHVDPSDRVYGYQVSPLPSFLISSILRTLSCARKGSFQFCISGSGLTAPIAGLAKLFYKIPAISFVHGLDLIVKNSLYQRLFIPWLKQMDIIIANSENTARIVCDKGIEKSRIRVLHPGVEIPKIRNRKNTHFRSNHRLEGKKILLSVGRLLPRKGLAEFLLYSFPDIIRKSPEAILVIIGEEPQKALSSSSGYHSRLVKIIQENNLDENVRMLGYVSDDTLHEAYQEADLFIFPLKETPGDVEGFGMVATEAAAHGLPTVAFAAGGVTDAINHGSSGYLVKERLYKDFTDIIVNHLDQPSQNVNRRNCIEFAQSLSWNKFGEGLLNICSEL